MLPGLAAWSAGTYEVVAAGFPLSIFCMMCVVENLKVSLSLLVTVIGTNWFSLTLMLRTFCLGILLASRASLFVYPPYPEVIEMAAAAEELAPAMPLMGLLPETSIVK